MKKVVAISLGASRQDFEFVAPFMGQKVSVQRRGANGSSAKAIKLIKYWEKHANVIGLGIDSDNYAVGSRRYADEESTLLTSAVTRVAVTTGGRLNEILQEWALRHVQHKLGNYFSNAKVLFFSGMRSYKLAAGMAEYTQNLQFADPLLQFGAPTLLTTLKSLELYASVAHHTVNWVPTKLNEAALVRQWKRFALRRAMQEATVIVAPVHELDEFGAEDLAGKTLITSAVSEERTARFKEKGVHMVVDGSPNLFGHVLGPHILDAMIIATSGKNPQNLLEDDYLEIIGDRRHALDRGGLRRGFREDRGQGHTRPSPARRPFPAERGDDVWSRRKAKEYPGGYGS